MAYAMQLQHLIQNELIPDVEDHIDAIFEAIASAKEATSYEKAELTDLQALRDEYKALLGELDRGEIDEEECEQLYTDLTAMRSEEDEEFDDLMEVDYDDEEEEDEDDYDELDLEDEEEYRY